MAPQELELLPEQSFCSTWYGYLNYHNILCRTEDFSNKITDTYEDKPLYVYVIHFFNPTNKNSALTISISEPMCLIAAVPKYFSWYERKQLNSLLGKTKKEKQVWLKEYFTTKAKTLSSLQRLTFICKNDWQIASKEVLAKHNNKLEIDYGRKCSKMLKKLEEDRLLIGISKLAEGVKLPPGVKGKKSKPIPKKEDFDILL